MVRTYVRALLSCLLMVCLVPLHAQQSPVTHVSRVRIHLTPELAPQLPQAQIDLTHGKLVPGRFFITELNTPEIARVRALGFSVDILVDDVTAEFQQTHDQRGSISCPGYQYDYRVPVNFEFGSMGGYLNYSEILDALDLMQILYPDIISIRKRVGDEVTYQGRPLYWVRISDNPEEDEPEPEVLYTALHHAREPMSMMQMIYYMWYLLEGYGKDPESTYLINNTELYFIPCVNPDGYIYNQQIAPEGGGQWRKNLRDNDGNGVFDENEDGVDINRNYGYQWGLDEEGSSGNGASQVYRGPEPFSEPETRAMRDFIEEHKISFALNYHAFGNYFIYPWGYTEDENPEFQRFSNYGELMTVDNGFDYGNSLETVGYPTNGCSDDWMYAEHSVYAMTPELGGDEDGFWPGSEKIIPLSQASLMNNLALAHLPHRFAIIRKEAQDAFFTSRDGQIDVTIKSYAEQNGDMALTILSLSPELQVEGSILDASMEMFNEQTFSLGYTLDASTVAGQEFSYIIRLDNGFFEIRDTVTRMLAGETIAFFEDGDDLAEWSYEGTTWGSTSEDAHNGNTCLTDSPNGIYAPNEESILRITNPINLHDAMHASLEYWIKWEIEDYIDYAQVQISTDGTNFEALCGSYTKPGSIFQVNEPIYDGVQSTWVKESMDLTPYIGNDIYIRFVLVSDGYLNLDGVYLDDIVVRVYNEEVSATQDPRGLVRQLSVWPNPATDQIWVAPEISPSTAQSWLQISDAQGAKLEMILLEQGNASFRVGTTSWTPGLYFISLFEDGRMTAVRKVTIE